MATYTLAKGTKFYTGDAGESEVFTAVTGVTTITWSGTTWSTEDTTSNDNATPVKTVQPTIYTNGDISLVIDYDPSNTQHALLRSESISGALRNFEMEQVNTAEKVGFQGFVSSFAWDSSTTGLLKAKIKVTINGAFTVIAGV